jgi:general secretion pathway protein C
MTESTADLLLRHRHARAFALAAVAAAGVALAIALARLAAVLLAFGAPAAPPATPMTVEQLVRGAESGAASVSSWHLFGNALPAADPRGVAAAPDTGLDLVLRGLFAGDDPKDGRAILVDGSGVERSVRPGDEVASGVTLDGVYPDRVTLSRGGVIEALRLPRPDGGVAPAAASGSGPGGIAIQNRPLPPSMLPQAAGGTLPGMAAPGQPFVTPSVSTAGMDWNAATAKLGVDAQQLAREVSVLPVLENGRFVGVRVQAGRDNPLAAKLGLQPDDIVTEVNGVPLDSPARAAEVARTLAQANRAEVTVRRNGSSRKLRVDLP